VALMALMALVNFTPLDNFTPLVPFTSPPSANGALATFAFFAVCRVLIRDFLLIVMTELLIR
jgi:hypothetical protein